jgi:hypothetical protein
VEEGAEASRRAPEGTRQALRRRPGSRCRRPRARRCARRSLPRASCTTSARSSDQGSRTLMAAARRGRLLSSSTASSCRPALRLPPLNAAVPGAGVLAVLRGPRTVDEDVGECRAAMVASSMRSSPARPGAPVRSTIRAFVMSVRMRDAILAVAAQDTRTPLGSQARSTKVARSPCAGPAARCPWSRFPDRATCAVNGRGLATASRRSGSRV